MFRGGKKGKEFWSLLVIVPVDLRFSLWAGIGSHELLVKKELTPLLQEDLLEVFCAVSAHHNLLP
ncbi:hypothetical protein C4D60_Mb05t19200 [Musa balbisiana]|uniref:Uncharacterized protein n=1 Tax=Musa balbisiana TaxID=52838 RepID=A0A4S8JX83_MUSBA|nr:hypothetical protein C4D60_Mb05t19200 [Musa balbisiana]